MDSTLLRTHVECMTRLKIAELERWPEPIVLEKAKPELSRIAHALAEKGDVLQFGGKGAGDLVSSLVWALAVLAFLPGGVDFLGLHFEANHPKGDEHA